MDVDKVSADFGLHYEHGQGDQKIPTPPVRDVRFRLLETLIPLLPRQAVIALAWMAGQLAMRFASREVRIGMQNLDAVFGDRISRTEKRRILRISFSTFAQTMMDVFWFSRRTSRRISRYVRFEDSPLKARFLEDRPVICITAHIGNWEILGQTCAWMDVDLASIAATVKNGSVNRILNRHRERTGQTIIPRKGALRTLVACIRRHGKAAFVLDQKTAENEGGILVDFLGLPMSVSPAPAALSYRTGTEIMFGFCLPDPGGRYRIRITGSLSPPPFDRNADPDAIILEMSRQIMERVSEEILAHPGFWLWSYKHFRRVPGRTYPDHFPAY